MRQGFRPCDVIAFACMARFGQRSKCHCRNIARVHDAYFGFTCTRVKCVLRRDGEAEIEKTLHEEIRAQKRKRHT